MPRTRDGRRRGGGLGRGPAGAMVTSGREGARRRSRAGRRDGGSGSVLVVGAMAVVLVVGVSALLLAGVVRATHEARAAADLASLAAAQRLAVAGDPASACDAGLRVAGANGARLESCAADVVSGEVEVQVSVPVPVPGGVGRDGSGPPAVVGRLGPAVGWSRAGPAGTVLPPVPAAPP